MIDQKYYLSGLRVVQSSTSYISMHSKSLIDGGTCWSAMQSDAGFQFGFGYNKYQALVAPISCKCAEKPSK
jgi:hypothetical protein